jgi:gamma-glutamylcyclotransferase (GGCT)/AIG2-like uncharacterized protein YtfP
METIIAATNTGRGERRHRVGVYGSLRQGQGNHGLINGWVRVGTYSTPPRFTLHSLGSYPGMTDGGTTAVRVEVYDVDDATLARLDVLEGNGRFYERRRITVHGAEDPGSPPSTIAWIYVLLPEHQARTRGLVDSGDWVAHLQDGGSR